MNINKCYFDSDVQARVKRIWQDLYDDMPMRDVIGQIINLRQRHFSNWYVKLQNT